MGSMPHTMTKAFPPGIHVPSLTWFKDSAEQEIDWDTQKKHLDFLVKSGLHGSTINTLEPSQLQVLIDDSCAGWYQWRSRYPEPR